MGEQTKIEWCDHTFNPWIGCTKVSPGCAHCYAEALDHRWGHDSWGPGKPRRRTSDANWKQPLKWDREAQEARSGAMVKSYKPDGTIVWVVLPARPRVFCASLADWLDDGVPIEWLADLLDLIRRTPNLDWLLLTKRPENWRRRILGAEMIFPIGTKSSDMLCEWLHDTPPANVWIGTTVENQEMADKRIPELLKIPARVRFLSCEPMLGPVDLVPWLFVPDPKGGPTDLIPRNPQTFEPALSWVIAGGESGPGARPMHPDWARGLRDQCKTAGMPFLFKQWGEWSDCGDAVDRAVEGVRRADNERIVNLSGGHGFHGERPMVMARVGKIKAGRFLDGVQHNEFPTTKGSA